MTKFKIEKLTVGKRLLYSYWEFEKGKEEEKVRKFLVCFIDEIIKVELQ